MIDWIQTHIPPWVYIALIVHLAVLGTVAYLILLERKIASWVQDRIGPNRVGLGFGIIPGLKNMHMFGLGQPLADGLKFILKEDYRPKNTDSVLFTLAPAVMIVVVIISIAVIPWGGWRQTSKPIPAGQTAVDVVPPGSTIVSQSTSQVTYRWPFQIANLNIGVLFVLGTLSLAVYGVVIGGWASNNKYSFLGGLRATANMISYEVPLGLAVITIVTMFGTLDLGEIVEKQVSYWGHITLAGHTIGLIPAWNVFCQPLAFLMFLVCIHAEANRAPFDTAEAEQELVGGYHTEYSSMRFALFFLAEYAGMVTTSAVCVALFFGGWHFPWVDQLPVFQHMRPDPTNPAVTSSLAICVIRALIFFGKTLTVIGVFMWVRWSLPRFRFDQIMDLAWRALIPISLGQFFITVMVIWFFRGTARAFMRLPARMAVTMLVANLVLLAVTMVISTLIPAGPDTNRKIKIPGSRFEKTPLPAGVGA